MTYEDLIKQWFYRALGEVDYFTKYIFLHIAFTALLAQRWDWESDRNRINLVKNDTNARDYYLMKVRDDEHLRDTLLGLINELTRQPIMNSTRNSGNRNWKGTDGVLNGVDDWENLVEFWYRVRNNLFHGHKAPEVDRDARLVKFAYLTLLPLMQNFIDP